MYKNTSKLKNVENSKNVVDVNDILTYLSRVKGKIEVTFQKNENPAYESLCLVFIKIPIYGDVVDILKEVIYEEGMDTLPLSKGKIAIDEKDTDLYSLVGAVRVKSVSKLSEIVSPVISRMRAVLKQAIIDSKSGRTINYAEKDKSILTLPKKREISWKTEK